MPPKLHRVIQFGALLFIAIALPVIGQQRKPQLPSSVRLYVFDCGTLDIPDTSAYQLKKEELATTKMSVPCFLVAHPRGTLMWDVGAVPDSSFKADGTHAPLRYATSKKRLTDQLAQVGFAPSDITYLSMSHFHWDHVGNSNLFAPTVTWLVRKLERDIMFTEPLSPRTEPQNYNALKNAKTVIVTKAEHDVFGDGTVILKSAPGHSPDHQVLFLTLAKTGPVLLSGDLYHYPEELKLKKIPTTEFNADQTRASRVAIDEFLKKTHAQLWIQHDFIADAKLKKSPAFYD